MADGVRGNAGRLNGDRHLEPSWDLSVRCSRSEECHIDNAPNTRRSGGSLTVRHGTKRSASKLGAGAFAGDTVRVGAMAKARLYRGYCERRGWDYEREFQQRGGRDLLSRRYLLTR